MIAGLTLPVTLAAPVAGSPVASPAPGGSGFARALSAAEPAQSTPVAEAAADPAAETALPDTNLAAAMAANRAPAAPRSPQGAKSILQLHGHGATRPMATEATATEADDPVSAPARAPDEGLPAEPRVSEAPPSLQSLLAGLQLPPATNESGRADGLPGPAPLSREGPSTRPERAGSAPGVHTGPFAPMHSPIPNGSSVGAVLAGPKLTIDDAPPAQPAQVETKPGLRTTQSLVQALPEPAAGAARRLSASTPTTRQPTPGMDTPAGVGPVRSRLQLDPDSKPTARTGEAAPNDAAATIPPGSSGTATTGWVLIDAAAAAPTASPVSDPVRQALANVGTNLPLPNSPMPAPSDSTIGSPVATSLQITASPGSPGFAPELGAQIRTFVRQGVESARLELHPAEMGPVTVQILVEGATAQVRLFAEMAGTRYALEQAMPTLAGQLRESGLTLTGGGVFEQAQPGSGQASDPQGREARPGSSPDSRETARPQAEAAALVATGFTRRRGVVDLIA